MDYLNSLLVATYKLFRVQQSVDPEKILMLQSTKNLAVIAIETVR